MFLLLSFLAYPVSSSSFKLPLVVAATKARFSGRIPFLEDSIRICNDVMSNIPQKLRSDVRVRIQDAEELTTCLLTELYILSAHHDRFQSAESDLVELHRKLVISMKAFEDSLSTASRGGDASLAERFEDLTAFVQRLSSPLSDIRKLLKSRRLTLVVGQCVSQMKALFVRVDELEEQLPMTDIEEVVSILSKPMHEVSAIMDGIMKAFRTLMILQFQSELQHVRVRRRPRMKPVNAAAADRVKIDARSEFKVSFSTAVTFGRRLDVLLTCIPSFISVIRKRVALTKCDTELALVDRWIEQLMMEKQQSYGDLLVNGEMPPAFPLLPSRGQSKREIRLIRSFMTRYISVSKAAGYFQQLKALF